MLESMWNKGDIHPLLVEMQNCAITLEIYMAASQKIEDEPNSGSSNMTLGYIPRRCSIIVQRHMFSYVYSSFICNSQILEPT